MQMLARVEGMPLDSLAAATDWGWTSFASYLDRARGHGHPEPGLPGRPLGHPPGGHGPGRQRADRHRPTRWRPCAPLLGREPGGRGAGLLVLVGADPSRRRRLRRCRRAGPTRPSCWSCARRSGATPARRSSSSPAWATSPRPRATSWAGMSAAADRPLNWNVLVVHRRHGRQDPAPSWRRRTAPRAQGGRVLGLTIPMSVRPRLSFASGFLLDTIPGWQGPMTEPHADRLARLASPEAAPGPAGDGRRRPAGSGQLRPVRAHRVHHARDQGLRGPDGGRRGRRAGRRALRRAVRHRRGQRPAHRLLLPALRRQPRPTGRPGSEVWRDPRAIIGASDAGAHLDFLATFNYPTVLLRRAVADLGLLVVGGGHLAHDRRPRPALRAGRPGSAGRRCPRRRGGHRPRAHRSGAGGQPRRPARPAAGGSTAGPPASTTCW